MWETWVQSLSREDPLEKEMATHSSIHTWKIPWMEEPGGLQSLGSQRVGRLSDFSSSMDLHDNTPHHSINYHLIVQLSYEPDHQLSHPTPFHSFIAPQVPVVLRQILPK